MQVKGVDFLCGNEACKCHGNRITIHGAWPLKDIDLAIAGSDGEAREWFEKQKASGRDKALFVFPADNRREPSGYRVQAYCENELAVFSREFATLEEADSFEWPACEGCGNHVRSLRECVDFGIKCPSCGEKLVPNSWFTKV